MKYQIWMEGYAATGGRQGAQYLGEYESGTFDQAVESYNSEILGRGEHGSVADKDTGKWMIWACKLFDNETDARTSFG